MVTTGAKQLSPSMLAAVARAEKEAKEARSIWNDGDILDGGSITEFLKSPTKKKAETAVKKNWGLVALIGISLLITIKKQLK